MSIELQEVNDLLDQEKNPEEAQDVMETAIQALLFHQIIYEDMHTVPKVTLDIIKKHRLFFEKYFSAAGMRLVVDLRTQMIALTPKEKEKPPYAWRQMRLRKDETLVRLALRYIFEEGWRSGAMDSTGRVDTDSNQIIDVFRRIGKIEPPSETMLRENILKDLARRGAIKMGDRDKEERITRATILPGIRIIVSDSFMDRLEEWLTSGLEGDFFEAKPEGRTPMMTETITPRVADTSDAE